MELKTHGIGREGPHDRQVHLTRGQVKSAHHRDSQDLNYPTFAMSKRWSR